MGYTVSARPLVAIVRSSRCISNFLVGSPVSTNPSMIDSPTTLSTNDVLEKEETRATTVYVSGNPWNENAMRPGWYRQNLLLLYDSNRHPT